MPVRDTKDAMASRLLQRVMNITDVVAACRDTGFEWLEQLLDNVMFAVIVAKLWLCLYQIYEFYSKGTNNEVIMFIDTEC